MRQPWKNHATHWKHPRNYLETPMKNSWPTSLKQNPMKYPFSTIEAPMKHLWNTYEHFLKHFCNTLEQFLKLPRNKYTWNSRKTFLYHTLTELKFTLSLAKWGNLGFWLKLRVGGIRRGFRTQACYLVFNWMLKLPKKAKNPDNRAHF